MIRRNRSSQFTKTASLLGLAVCVFLINTPQPASANPKSAKSNAEALARLIELAENQPDVSAENWNSPEEFEQLYSWLCDVLVELDEIVAASEKNVNERQGKSNDPQKTKLAQTTNNPMDDITSADQEDFDSTFAQNPDNSIFFGNTIYGSEPLTSALTGIDAMMTETERATINEKKNPIYGMDDIIQRTPTQASSERVGRFVKPFVNTWYFDWPWVARDGQNMFFWVIGPPVGAATVLALGFFVFANRPQHARR